MSLRAEKLDQAAALLRELDLDVWLTFVRETTGGGDPVLPLILGVPLTWQSALIVARGGERVAIVGHYEHETVRSTGAWPVVVPYVQSIREPLVETLARLAPRSIAVNFSIDDVKADGLSHGMYELLRDYLAESGLAERLVSAQPLVTALRSRKTPGEIERMRRAIAITDEIFAAVARWAAPGRSEVEISRFMHEQARERGVTTAWESAGCPIVTTGPDSMVGHGAPSADLRIGPGNVFHLDFGVVAEGYCSDIQRAWYVPRPGERVPPPALQRAFDAIVRAIDAAAAALRPGARGFEVDAAARSALVAAGYPEYRHATGHHVGRSAHDGGAVLGPRWERYGRTPEYIIEPGNVVTLELGIDDADGRGYLGLEEMALVTKAGCEFLTTRQTALPLLGA